MKMILVPIILLSCLTQTSLADICGNHASLIEQDKFFLSQPYSVETELDFENYLYFFKTAAKLLPLFKNGLENYTSEQKIKSLEPWQSVPFDKNRNVILLQKLVPDTSKAFQACAENGNELISFHDNATKALLASAIGQLGLSFAPVKVVPLFDSVFDPQLRYLDSPGKELVEAIAGGSVPYLLKNGSMAYSATTTASTISVADATTAPAAPVVGNGRKRRSKSAGAEPSASGASTTASPPSGRTLCFRQNNPWDREKNLPGWLSKVKQIFNSVNVVEKLISSFNKAKKIINNLDTKATSSVKKIKLALPPAMKNLVDFLQSFADVSKWETLVPEDEKQFDNFLHDVRVLDNSLGFRDKSMLQLKKEGQAFNVPLFDESNWLENLGLDSSVHRILGPIFIQPLGLTKSPSQGDEAKSIVAKANFGIFHLNEGTTVYTVEPNIQKGEVISAKYVVASHANPFATMDFPSLIDCQQLEGNSLKACRSVNVPFVTNEHQQKMIDCAKSLLNKDLSANLGRCPRLAAPSAPFAYRAQCNDSSQISTTILNSVSPLKIAVVCNGQEHSIKEFSQFPVKMETECEIQEIEGEVKKVLLPQMQKDFLQDYYVANVVTLAPEISTSWDPEMYQSALIILATTCGVVFVLVGAILIIICLTCPSRLKCNRQRYDVEKAQRRFNTSDTSARQNRTVNLESTRISRAPSRRSLGLDRDVNFPN